MFLWIDKHGKGLVGGLLAIAIPFLVSGPEAGAIIAAVAIMVAAVLWTPLRRWLGLPERVEDQPKRIGIDADEESKITTKGTRIRGQDTGVRLRGGSTHDDEHSEIE